MTQTTALRTAVTLAGLHKSYGDVHEVDGVDLAIAPGEVVALLGPNGAGKSTTVDMLLGLTEPDRGDISVFGQTPREAVVTGTIGAMPQSGSLLDDATVAETVGLVAALHREPLTVAEALARVDITDLANLKCTKLSGGQKQRVRFALALVCDPDLLVLDEPTVGLDPVLRVELWDRFHALADGGTTLIVSSHVMDEAARCDRLLLLRDGELIADSTPAQLRIDGGSDDLELAFLQLIRARQEVSA
jgi:ABC-2 type transport system ATP-binding protein